MKIKHDLSIVYTHFFCTAIHRDAFWQDLVCWQFIKVQKADLMCHVIRKLLHLCWPIRDEYSNFSGATRHVFYKITTLRVFTEMLNQFRILVSGLKSCLKIDIHCKPIPCNKNRVFPVKFSHREIPVMKTGVPTMSKIKKKMSHPSKARTKFLAVPTYFNLVWIQKINFRHCDFSFLNPFCCLLQK